MQSFQLNQSISIVVSFLMLVAMLSVVGAQPATSASGSLTGNVGIVSKYIFRGVIESDRPAVQGGLDYSHPSGLYAGYWGSTLDYGGASTGSTSSENDVYAGYAGSAGPASYDVGVTQFTYLNEASDAGLTEAKVSAGLGPISVGVNYALNDGFANEGDIYASASYSQGIPFGFTFSSKVGYTSPDAAGAESDWNDIVVGLSHPIGDSPASMGLQYVSTNTDPAILGNATENQIVMSISYGFDIPKE